MSSKVQSKIDTIIAEAMAKAQACNDPAELKAAISQMNMGYRMLRELIALERSMLKSTIDLDNMEEMNKMIKKMEYGQFHKNRVGVDGVIPLKLVHSN